VSVVDRIFVALLGNEANCEEEATTKLSSGQKKAEKSDKVPPVEPVSLRGNDGNDGVDQDSASYSKLAL
jgi:hypothetical protein